MQLDKNLSIEVNLYRLWFIDNNRNFLEPNDITNNKLNSINKTNQTDHMTKEFVLEAMNLHRTLVEKK